MLEAKFNLQNVELSSAIEIKQKPYVDDKGIWMPVNEYAPSGTASVYRLVMSKEMFIEAYNKWLKDGEEDLKPVKHGHWIYNKALPDTCSVCGFHCGSHDDDYEDRYCSHCGAKMDEGEIYADD